MPRVDGARAPKRSADEMLNAEISSALKKFYDPTNPSLSMFNIAKAFAEKELAEKRVKKVDSTKKSQIKTGAAYMDSSGAPLVSPDAPASVAETARAVLGVASTGKSNSGFGANQLKKRISDLHDHAYGGDLKDKASLATKKDLKYDPWDGARAVTLNPNSVKVNTFNVLHEEEGYDAGIEGVICSSSAVSRVIKVLNDWIEENIGITTCDVDECSDQCNGNYWCFSDIRKFLSFAFEQFGIHKLNLDADFPYVIKIAFDGAPTTKHLGLVTLSLVLCDPRTNEEIRLTPQSKKWCFPIAGYFGGESFDELTAGFQWIIGEILAVECEGGVPVGDTRVPIKVCFGIDLSAAWHSMVDCGGAIGSSTWPCFWCAWHAMVRALGDPEGCSMCDDQCGHMDMDTPEKRARLKTRLDGLARKLAAEQSGDVHPLDRVMPLVLDRDHAVSELDKRSIPHGPKIKKPDAVNLLVPYCTVRLPPKTMLTSEFVAGMSADEVKTELGKHGLRTTGAVSTLRKGLVQRIDDVVLYRWLTLAVAYKGPGPMSLLDAWRIVTDPLHCEMRVNEVLLRLLGETMIHYPDKEERKELFEHHVHETGWKHFELEWGDEAMTHFKRQGLSRQHARNIMNGLDKDLRRDDGEASFLSVLMDDGDEKIELWETVVTEWVAAVSIMRMKPELLPGDAGYRAALEEHAHTMQAHLDTMTNALVEMYGDSVITNYLHMLRAGHFMQTMLEWGYLCYLAADAVEAMNGDNTLHFFNSHRGGSCGRGSGKRMTDHVEGLARRAAQKILWASKKAEEIREEHEKRVQEQRRLAGVRLAARRGSGGRRSNFKERCATRAAKQRRLVDARLKRQVGSGGGGGGM